MFKLMKDTRRRMVEATLQKTGLSEITINPELDELFKKFVERIDDMNETGAALASALVNQVSYHDFFLNKFLLYTKFYFI